MCLPPDGPSLTPSGVGSNSDVTRSAVERYQAIFRSELLNVPVDPTIMCDASAPLLVDLKIHIHADVSEPQLGVDESFSLHITSGDPNAIGFIEAATPFGAVYALEAFSQLLRRSAAGPAVNVSSLYVQDAPRFPWRGMLIDTGRHFLPVSALEALVDALQYHRFNVLHWHVSDNQAFPFVSSAHPRLAEYGAFSARHTYSASDVQLVRERARLRGVRVVLEFDMPGHSTSWFRGYPELSPDCPSTPWWEQALDPTRNETYEFIRQLLGDAAAASPDQFVHVGGDEVNGSCWLADSAVVSWMAQHAVPDKWALQRVFQERVAAMAGPLNRTFVVWEEAWNGSKLPADTVVQVWRQQGGALAEVLRSGYRAVFSPDEYWCARALPNPSIASAPQAPAQRHTRHP